MFIEELIDKSHNRKSFNCGEPALNDYLQKLARQDTKNNVSKTYVAISSNDSNNKIIGYYTVTPSSINFDDLPNSLSKGLAKRAVPVYLLCRLAIDVHFQNNGFGGQLLILAGYRCLKVAEQIGGIGLFIEAKNQAVAKWYESFGAIPLSSVQKLIIPFETIKQALKT
ncbi:GNAT family N-acetyltransferase [Xenorhabdus bovienii]|uniref:GNAT family N-acetyltransferase n=1 Tax=Xenorhabdus bovienii TaxID=40576 RepID=UPI00237CAB10|nr:GNAT family N-acetyltransferase [Xenorhabdus bovienii]MDE1488127.1 GNAT family N-acetyltransferase [Xenorhabdus bovienii]MDE9479017.1 GNAT family N-acetyltransferase [Xenorhabdus bovienii]MDE9532209.1 GNAT family N-acetyltransferase [Xenorhabdus bovienii]